MGENQKVTETKTTECLPLGKERKERSNLNCCNLICGLVKFL